MSEQFNGRVEGVFLGLVGKITSIPVAEARVTLAGFDGDRHAGMTYRTDTRLKRYPAGSEIRNSRQITIVSTDELEAIAAALGVPSLLPEWLGANLCFSGIPNLTQIAPYSRLHFPEETVLIVAGENKPCETAAREVQGHYPETAALASRFVKAALHLRGLIAWVERPGWIRPQDTVQVEKPE